MQGRELRKEECTSERAKINLSHTLKIFSLTHIQVIPLSCHASLGEGGKPTICGNSSAIAVLSVWKLLGHGRRSSQPRTTLQGTHLAQPPPEPPPTPFPSVFENKARTIHFQSEEYPARITFPGNFFLFLAGRSVRSCFPKNKTRLPHK